MERVLATKTKEEFPYRASLVKGGSEEVRK